MNRRRKDKPKKSKDKSTIRRKTPFDYLVDAVAREKALQEALFFGELGPPETHPKKSGRKVDPATVSKFVRMAKLKKMGKTWPQIEIVMKAEFEKWAGDGTYKELYRRQLPSYLNWYRNRFHPEIPEEVFLASVLKIIKGQPGRPKKSKRNN